MTYDEAREGAIVDAGSPIVEEPGAPPLGGAMSKR
jgi:hypothetical protein